INDPHLFLKMNYNPKLLVEFPSQQLLICILGSVAGIIKWSSPASDYRQKLVEIPNYNYIDSSERPIGILHPRQHFAFG
ncbi:hypothetical protein PAXRUDRAFT_161049, partial [Paxillus rubicundulus Ve08.2h10]